MEDIVALVNEAQNDSSKLSNLIEKFLPFIKSCVAKERMTKQSQDDVLTLAMLAFTESVKTYRPEKGQFFAYAQTSIRNRLIDDYRNERKQYKYEVYSEESPILENMSIDAFRLLTEREALQVEIEEAEQVLAAFNIILEEIPMICPKQKRTRARCEYIAALILDNDKWRNELLLKNRMPKSDICREYGVSEKVLEKFRKYIAALCLVQSGDYPILQAFLPMNWKGGVEE